MLTPVLHHSVTDITNTVRMYVYLKLVWCSTVTEARAKAKDVAEDVKLFTQTFYTL